MQYEIMFYKVDHKTHGYYTQHLSFFFFSFHFVSNLLVDILFYGIYSVQATFSGIHISESAN